MGTRNRGAAARPRNTSISVTSIAMTPRDHRTRQTRAIMRCNPRNRKRGFSQCAKPRARACNREECDAVASTIGRSLGCGRWRIAARQSAGAFSAKLRRAATPRAARADVERHRGPAPHRRGGHARAPLRAIKHSLDLVPAGSPVSSTMVRLYSAKIITRATCRCRIEGRASSSAATVAAARTSGAAPGVHEHQRSSARTGGLYSSRPNGCPARIGGGRVAPRGPISAAVRSVWPCRDYAYGPEGEQRGAKGALGGSQHRPPPDRPASGRPPHEGREHRVRSLTYRH